MHIYPWLDFDMDRTAIDGNEASPAGITWSHEVPSDWIEAQDSLKKKLVTIDDYTWKLPTTNLTSNGNEGGKHKEGGCGELKYVGGVDISFSKDDPSIACSVLVVMDFQSLEVLYEDFSILKLDVPYVPGFLAFREAPILLELLEKMKCEHHPFYPQARAFAIAEPLFASFIKDALASNIIDQLLMVDGNGLLHPRGFGLACHLGVLVDIPTIGIGKNLHYVDGLTQSRVRDTLKAEENFNNGVIPLIGDSGHTWGVAMQSTECSLKPIYVSVGHRISLAAAIEIVKVTCKYRVPEPVRQADIRSRDYLRKHQ